MVSVIPCRNKVLTKRYSVRVFLFENNIICVLVVSFVVHMVTHFD